MLDAPLASLIRSAPPQGSHAQQALFASLYEELHHMARRELRRGGALTLGATTLLHETYLKIARREGLSFPERGQFMAYAARAMRGLVVDYARRRQAQKRGGEFAITRLPTEAADASVDAEELQRVSDAVDALAAVDATLAQVVDLKYFCGFSFVEIAGMRGVSERTVLRDWEKARIFLHRALRD
jgi:RNA polymerase sigma factor (TIGR02999 family)